MSAEILEQAFASTAGVLSGLPEGQLDQPTPCASWKVRDLVNHIVGGAYFFAGVAETGETPFTEASPDFTDGDFVASFEEGAKQAVAAFSAPDVMAKTMKLPFGELPGSRFVWIASIDTFTHGWDLARASGQSTDLAPELAAQLLEVAEATLPDSMRGPDGEAPFGLPVEMADDSPVADRLAGFLGRHP